MYRIIATSDSHYGLKSAGYDRTDEIHRINKEIVQHCISSNADLFVHGGDLGHRASPDPRVYSLWVELWEELERDKINSYFMLGNHDVTHDKTRPDGSLSPLVALEYKHVAALPSPGIHFWAGDNKTVLLFLPYFNQASIGSNHNEYYDQWLDEFFNQHDPDVVVAFTHLNIENAAINDDHILRPVNAVVPKRLIEDDRVKLIVSGHIHKAQELHNGKLVVVGSPICTDFGDIGDKSFLDIEIDGDSVKYKRIPTNNIPLLELNYDLLEGHELNFIKSEIKNAGVKVKIRGTREHINQVNLVEFQKDLEKSALFVRPITPTIVRINSEKQSIAKEGMSDQDLVSKWIESRKPMNSTGISETAFSIMEQVE